MSRFNPTCIAHIFKRIVSSRIIPLGWMMNEPSQWIESDTPPTGVSVQERILAAGDIWRHWTYPDRLLDSFRVLAHLCGPLIILLCLISLAGTCAAITNIVEVVLLCQVTGDYTKKMKILWYSCFISPWFLYCGVCSLLFYYHLLYSRRLAGMWLQISPKNTAC